MPYLFKYTATRDTWGGVVKSGESFIVKQYSNAASHNTLKEHLNKSGRSIKSSSSIGGGALEVGETAKSSEWIIERIE
jgi:hypothetical protein